MESIQWFLLGVLFTLCVFGFAYASTRVKAPGYTWAVLIGATSVISRRLSDYDPFAEPGEGADSSQPRDGGER